MRRIERGAHRAHRRRLGVVATLAAVLVLGTVVVLRAASPSAAAASPSPGPSVSGTVLELHAVNGASYVPALEGRRPLFILALGSDARPGQAIAGQRSDSIHLIGVNLATHRATILGFPRDSWVNIPGHGMDKITTAMTYGGPELTVQTVEEITGIHIDFWALTYFHGLVSMVNGIGGLTVPVQKPMHDPYSGSDFNPGNRRMNGWQALAFARDRHSFLNGDLSRSGNQGILLLSALRKLNSVFKSDPATIYSWVSVYWKNVKTDLSAATLLQLAWTATQVSVKNVNNVVVPATTGMQGAESVVYILPSAHSLYTSMQRTGTAPGTFKDAGL